MTRWVAAAAVVVIALSACVPGSNDTATTSTRPPTTTTTSTTVAATGPDCLAGNLPFAEQGIVAALDSPQHDATRIGGIRWQPDDECERVVIEFLAEGGSPATRLGPVGVTIGRDSGIVRVALPEEIEASAIGDSLIDGSLVDHIYVVDGVEDGLIVDVHLAAHAAARAFTTNSPSRLVIDVRPSGEEPLASAPASNGRVVVSSPLPGPGLYPVQVAGYAAPGVGSVRASLSVDDTTTVERTVSMVSGLHVWHGFAFTVSDGPSGAVTLRVAAEGDEGVAVELSLP
jgi:hypothetical protein